MDQRRLLGDRGEDIAADFFIRRGYSVMARNWRDRVGELDLVVRKGDEVRFVEVKTRVSLLAGYPEASVTRRKLSKLEQLAEDFLDSRPDLPRDFHLDVLSLTVLPDGRIDHYYLPDIGAT
jgi:putative endonuclease